MEVKNEKRQKEIQKHDAWRVQENQKGRQIHRPYQRHLQRGNRVNRRILQCGRRRTGLGGRMQKRHLGMLG